MFCPTSLHILQVPRSSFTWVTKKLKDENAVSIPLVCTNRINTPDEAERALTEGCADMVSMARPFLADPDFVSKAMRGADDEINTCIACNQAVSSFFMLHFLTM